MRLAISFFMLFGAAGLHRFRSMGSGIAVTTIAPGRPHAPSRNVDVSRSQGDGLGFDIRSYEDDGTDRFIEVKTTNGGKNRSFYVSDLEVRESERRGDKYWLYRVFTREGSRKLFTD